MTKIMSYKELRVFQATMEAAMVIFQVSKTFPAEERFSMVDQIRRCSRSVCANLAESWRKRRYKAHFVSKLSDAESEAEETRVWLEFASRCGYIDNEQLQELDKRYDDIIGQIVRMLCEPAKWNLP